MHQNTFVNRLKKLQLNKKIVLGGSALMVIGVFLPWYNDTDKFNIGESFLGITGPTYLAGFLVLLSAVFSLGYIILKLMDRPVPKLPISESYLYISAGILSFLMLVLSASVYFHPKFGINVVDKTVGIGMIFAFIGSVIAFVGGVLSVKTGEVDFDTEGHLEPLIDVDLYEREKSHIGKNITVGEAEEMAAKKAEGADTRAWGQVQESINNFKQDDK